MKISKISRSLIVVIFVSLISYIIFLGINSIIDSNLGFYNIYRIIYIISIIILTIIYENVKSKFSKKGIKREINLIYRYMYIVIVTLFSKLIYININLGNIDITHMFKNLIILIITAIFVKRIIYNISKSDLLSVFGTFMFSMYPVANIDLTLFTRSNLLVLSVLVTIFVIQKLIDELKQIGIKNVKYMKLSIITSILIAINMIIGINTIVWIMIGITMLFIAENLDRYNLNFPNKIVSKLSETKKDRLYKLERIYFSKLIVVIFNITIITTITYFVIKGSNVMNYINNNIIDNIVNLFNSNINIAIENIKLIISNSNYFYIIISSYIILIEILTVLLQRRYDTKTTVIKSLFISIILIYSLLNIDIQVYSNLLPVILIIIAIINTSNLYLNREERVKLLKA